MFMKKKYLGIEVCGGSGVIFHYFSNISHILIMRVHIRKKIHL